MTDRFGVVACARQFLGVPFAHQGRSRAGLDCLGLLLVTAQAAEITFEGMATAQLAVPNYGVRPDTAMLRQQLDRFLVPIAKETRAPGDIVLLQVQGLPQHLAMLSDYPLAGELGMIHAYAPARKVVEHRYDEAWQRNTVGCYRLA